MSLLFLDSSEQTAALARNVYNRQFAEDARLESEYDDRRKREMYNGQRANSGSHGNLFPSEGTTETDPEDRYYWRNTA